MLRFGVVFLIFLLSAGASFGQTVPLCSVQTYETDAKQSLEACNRILSVGNLKGVDRAQALKIRARSFHKLGSLDAAVEDYEQALQLAPEDAELHLRRGWTAVDQKKPELAFDQARRALELSPSYAEVYHLIGVIHCHLGRCDDALAAYDEAIRLEPRVPLVHFNRQRILQNQGRNSEALKEAEYILSLPAEAITKPDAITFSQRKTTHRIAAAQERAELLQILGRIADAQQAWDWAVQTDPDAQTYAGRAGFNMFLARGDYASPAYDRARKDVSQSIALDPDFWLSRDIQARMYFYDGRYDDAEREFAKGIGFYPINGTMRWWRAMVLRKLDRVEEAATEAITAFEVDGGFMFLKLKMLRSRGYFPELRPDADVTEALTDAVYACMLDKECW
jgi:tetratricopeptide (TPR) repeat protein